MSTDQIYHPGDKVSFDGQLPGDEFWQTYTATVKYTHVNQRTGMSPAIFYDLEVDGDNMWVSNIAHTALRPIPHDKERETQST